MSTLNFIISELSEVVWGPLMLILLLGTGLWLTFSLGFIQIRFLPKALKLILSSRKTDHKEGEITPFQALTTSLSATIGTGNIAGVATAIATGGPGAIFWMWVSGFFGMATKYSEAVLAVKYRTRGEKGHMIGGPMYYISEGLGLKWMGILFAIFAIIASFGIGCMVQSHSVATAINDAFNIDKAYTGLILTILTAIVIIGGIKRLSKVTEKLIPLMSAIYILSISVVLIFNIDQFIQIIILIINSAFHPTAAFGGFAGATIRETARFGIARGLFSNEAGLGSAPIAHAAAKTDDPVKQGLIAMTGVFIDTIIICSLTAFAILLTGVWDSGKSGTELTSLAFSSTFGSYGPLIIAVTLSLFAYSTMLGWSYYGERCSMFLFGSKFATFYKIVFCIAIFVGAYWKTDVVWGIADIFNALMAIPNLIGLLGLSLLTARLTKKNIHKIDV